jgi:hypothetical protein
VPPTTGRNRTLVAGLCCTAAAAVVLTAHVVWLAVAWLTFEPPPDMEGPSVFAAMLLVGIVAAWMGLEALTVWIVFSDAVRRFPRGRWTAVALLIAISALHGLQTAWLATEDAAPEHAFSVGAVIPLTVAAAVLLARAPGGQTRSRATERGAVGSHPAAPTERDVRPGQGPSLP